MARIGDLQHRDAERVTVQREVHATYQVFEKDGAQYLQIDTYGAPDRKLVGKTSQTLQFDAQGIAALRAILAQLP